MTNLTLVTCNKPSHLMNFFFISIGNVGQVVEAAGMMFNMVTGNVFCSVYVTENSVRVLMKLSHPLLSVLKG